VDSFPSTPGIELSKLIYCTLGAAALLSLAACASSVKPEQVIGKVTPGMAQTEVVQRIGPPDREYSDAGNDCFQYALGDSGGTPYAVYFDGQHRVSSTQRGSCAGMLR
jgi:hypothetical protein